VRSLFLTPAHGLGHPIPHNQLAHRMIRIKCLSASGGRGFPGCCLFAVGTVPGFLNFGRHVWYGNANTDSANNGNPLVQVGAGLGFGV
jgi:hypothetical protein